jgi:hypothetical protein
MIDLTLIKLAHAAGYTAVASELEKANERASGKLWTESVMRLGRATEAVLYAVAREYHIDLQLHIPELSDIQNSLQGVQVNILKKQSTVEVKKLADLSKQIASAIAVLMENDCSRKGCAGGRPRGNDSILNELIEVIEDPNSKRRLGANKTLLAKVMNERNLGAHASPSGEDRETDPSAFPELAKDFQDLIQTILEVAIGERINRQKLSFGPT